MAISHGFGAPTTWASAIPPGSAMIIVKTASSRRNSAIGRSIPFRSPNPDPRRAGSQDYGPTGPCARDQGPAWAWFRIRANIHIGAVARCEQGRFLTEKDE